MLEGINAKAIAVGESDPILIDFNQSLKALLIVSVDILKVHKVSNPITTVRAGENKRTLRVDEGRGT